MKLYITTFLVFFTFTLFGQEKLIVNYFFNYEFDTSKSTDDKTIQLYKESNKNTGEYLLISSNEESIFNNIEKINNNQENNRSENISIPLSKNYINYKEHYLLDSFEFQGKKIIVKDFLAKYNWIIEKDQDEIIGYKVKKAIAKKDNIIYEAWFAPSLPFKSGPGNYWGLPGVILKLGIYMNQDDGIHKRYYSATKVELNDKVTIVRPTKGMVFTENEFIAYFNEQFRIQNEIENSKVNTKID